MAGEREAGGRGAPREEVGWGGGRREGGIYRCIAIRYVLIELLKFRIDFGVVLGLRFVDVGTSAVHCTCSRHHSAERGVGSGKKKGETKSVARLCCNPGCGADGAKKRCERCRRVVHCCRRCQKVHWTAGGRGWEGGENAKNSKDRSMRTSESSQVSQRPPRPPPHPQSKRPASSVLLTNDPKRTAILEEGDVRRRGSGDWIKPNQK